jgi:hypothetical protein
MLKALRARGRRKFKMTSRTTESWPRSTALSALLSATEVLPTDTATTKLNAAASANNVSSLPGFMCRAMCGVR